MSRQPHPDLPIPAACLQAIDNLNADEREKFRQAAIYSLKGWLQSTDGRRIIIRCKMEYHQGNTIEVVRTARFLVHVDAAGWLVDFERIRNKERMKRLQGVTPRTEQEQPR